MHQLLQALSQGLTTGLDDLQSLGEPDAAAPFVYVTAIASDAGLTRSLAGITLISREIGFDRDAETTYSGDGASAIYHAQHRQSPVALAVEVCTPRRTVSIAVSGRDNDETYRLFLEADTRLFGDC
ncbi:MAG: hypothetical protein RLZZ219_1803 [Cyanobacteriota bacterium]|jgi:hypothetical protein